MLTIAIPTYNRNETLLKNLALLLPQLTPECRLLILDNCSDVPVEETLRPLLSQHPNVSCGLVRNSANIGANANITRCVEQCETLWVWVLGDDDAPRPDAITNILRHIEEHPDAVLLNFSADGLRPRTVLARGVRELARKLDASADLPWISSSVYNAEAFKKQLKFGYQYAYSMLPHVVMLLMAVNANPGATCCFSPERIVEGNTRTEAPPEQQWSLVNFALGYPVLPELPLEARARETLLEKLLVTQRGDGLNLRFLLYQLMLMATRSHDARTALYIWDQVCSRRYYFDTRLPSRAKRFACRMMLKFPTLSQAAYKIVKRQALGGQGQKLQDRYSRM